MIRTRCAATRNAKQRFLPSFAVFSMMCLSAVAPTLGDELFQGFQSPPPSAKPRVWWHWMNGNVTETGIKADFEWMQRVGIGGVQNFDAAIGWGGADNSPQVDQPLAYLTPEWRRAFRYAVDLANQAGMEFTIASSPGWSVTGGPWVKPQEAMKKLVWSETQVAGGAPFKGRIAKPPQGSGAFRDIPFVTVLHTDDESPPTYYADIAVIAYRAPAVETPLANLAPKVTSSAGALDAARLYDGDLVKPVPLPFGESKQAWIEFTFAQSQRIQALTAVLVRPLAFDPLKEPNPAGWLEASLDGQTFQRVTDLPEKGTLQQTVSFTPVRAKVFRVVLERPVPTRFEQAGLASGPPRVAHQITELMLHTAARVNRFEDKAGFSSRQIVDQDDTPAVTPADAVASKNIIDLTGRLRPDGSLHWTPPKGRWTVLRFGYSLTGHLNHPASRSGTGLEVDKLNRRHVKRYMEAYLSEYDNTLGPQGVQFMLTDSYEAGIQNWTDDFLDQFKARRHYSAEKWLPVLAGRVVDSALASDRFLWDFRKTIAELMSESHYGQISASLHERGMRRYGESHEVGRAFVMDGMDAKKTADVPMGAMWSLPPPMLPKEAFDADIRESASVAHIYGQNLVAAESLTALGDTYAFSPEILKPVADRMMAMGLNRFVIHTSVHQPTEKLGPGLGLGAFGQWFTRKETWAETAGAWISYLTRSAYLLQQGRFVADIAYLYGEDTNVTSLFGFGAPQIPQGYNFDFVNAAVLLNELSVRDGKLVTRTGMSYSLLALDPSTRRMSLPLLRRLRDLVRAGAAIVGPRPTQSPSLMDDDQEFRSLVTELWGEAPGTRVVEAGTVFADMTLPDALQALQVPTDVTFNATAENKLRFVHRNLEQSDIYFVSNAANYPQTVEAGFRVQGRLPELWRADNGGVRLAAYRTDNGRTAVTLKLDANDAIFVVFRETASAQAVTIPQNSAQALARLDGPWEVGFAPNLGAPAQARFDALRSWTEHADAGVKYFSGTATYRQTLKVRRDWLKNRARVQLHLGVVKNLAEVVVNGKSLGVLWKAPFKIDITDALKSGDNRLEIKVTNLWPNRLIGDKQPGAQQIAFASFDPYKADSPLLDSGLLGPVSLVGIKEASPLNGKPPATSIAW